MLVSKEIKPVIEELKAKIGALGHHPVAPEAWELDDDGSSYASSLLDQLLELA